MVPAAFQLLMCGMGLSQGSDFDFDMDTDGDGDASTEPVSGTQNPFFEVVRPLSSWRLIHQQEYTPDGARRGFTPEDPICFSVDGVPGISIAQAADGTYTGLDGRDDRMSAFKSSCAFFRIQVGSITSQMSFHRHYFY